MHLVRKDLLQSTFDFQVARLYFIGATGATKLDPLPAAPAVASLQVQEHCTRADRPYSRHSHASGVKDPQRVMPRLRQS